MMPATSITPMMVIIMIVMITTTLPLSRAREDHGLLTESGASVRREQGAVLF
jgi:hypothetical protein